MIIVERIKNSNNKYEIHKIIINEINDLIKWIFNKKAINNLQNITSEKNVLISKYLIDNINSEKTSTDIIKNISKLYVHKYHLNPNYWIERGYNSIDAIANADDRAGNTRLTNLIKRHGEIKGKEIYNKLLINSSQSHTLSGMISRYGEIEGRRKFTNFSNNSRNVIHNNFNTGKLKKSDSACNINELISRHGEIEGKRIYEHYRLLNIYQHTEQFYVDKYGNDIGKQKYIDRLKKVHLSAIGKASMESLVYFIPLYKELRKNGILRDDIYFGVNGSYEYFILDDDNKIYFYDFTIRSKKIIIEYHGESFHPNPSWLNDNTDKWKNWIQPYSKQSANDVYNRDKYKKLLAINNGFTYFEIYSSDDYNETLKKIIHETKNICNK